MNLQIDSSHSQGEMSMVEGSRPGSAQSKQMTLFAKSQVAPMKSSLPSTMPNSVKNSLTHQNNQRFIAKQNIITNKSQNKLILG